MKQISGDNLLQGQVYEFTKVLYKKGSRELKEYQPGQIARMFAQSRPSGSFDLRRLRDLVVEAIDRLDWDGEIEIIAGMGWAVTDKAGLLVRVHP